jgi:hypothetical protein
MRPNSRKSQSGGLKKSGGDGRPTLPDSGGKVKKRNKVFPFNNLVSLNLDFRKKLLKKVKKSQKTNYGNHPVPPPVFFNFFTTHIAGCQFDSRKFPPPLAATYCLRGGEYKDPITSPCGILLRLSADTLFPAI